MMFLSLDGKTVVSLQYSLYVIFVTHILLVHPSLQFISHFPSTVMGEQLVAQLFRAIPEKHWLFQYGRVPLSFILSENIYNVRNSSLVAF